jgi:prolyl oligopeptidase
VIPIETRADLQQVDTLAGVSFPDPYHWLEAQTQEVQAWQEAQAECADAHVRRWPHYDDLAKRIENLQGSAFSGNHQLASGRWFRSDTPTGGSHPCVIVSDALAGVGRVIFDPAAQDTASLPHISWMRPAPDGRTVALGLCTDGSENNRIALIDVETGASLPGAPERLLMDNWLGGVQWLPDSSGFYFTALRSDSSDFTLDVAFHLVDGSTAPPLPPAYDIGRDYSGVRVSRCRRWATLMAKMMSGAPKAILDLTDIAGGWQPFVTDFDGLLAGDMEGDHFIAVTDAGAPRGRVVAIAFDSRTPNDPASWPTLIAESDAVIRSARVVGDRLYVQELVDTYARIRIFDLQGEPLGEVPLPGRGTVTELPITLMNFFSGSTGDAFLFGFSSFTQSAGLYLYRPGAAEVETISPPAIHLDGVIVEDRWVTSTGGARVPYHVIRLADLDRSAPQPTIVYAYGAYNAPLKPQYQSALAAFVMSGGVYAHAHIRGGGDLGRDWWDDGRLKNKQHGYDDLYAVAEDLITRQETSPAELAVMGGSNGGLMAAVAATQRPDLWRAVVPRVPMCDLIGTCREPYGRYIVQMEYADPTDPDEVRRLAGFSPYQLVEDGRHYPAVYLDAGATDPRCPAWHARKLGARLQAAQGGPEPILVRIWENVGHGWATPRSVLARQDAGWLAFVMERVGLVPRLSTDKPT